MDYSPIFEAAGRQFNVDPALAQAVMMAESGGNPSAVSPKGATGPMQLMPGTAGGLGVNPADPVQNITGGVKYLGQMLDKYGSVPLAVAAYNAGPGAVDTHKGIPPFPETQKYVQNVLGRYQGAQPAPVQQDMPGLPPTESATPGVDPFAGMPSAAPAPAASAGGLVDPFAGLPAPKASASSAAPAPKAPDTTPWDSFMRQAGLTARAGVTGLAGLPTMLGDAANGAVNLGIQGINAATGSHIALLQMPSAMLQSGMNSIGVPQPQNATERVVQGVASGMAGVAPFVGAGNAIAKVASPVAQAIGNGMAALPGMQMTGAAGAAAAGGVARENGVGPMGQLGYGVLGGLAGAVAPSAALALARGAKGVANNVAGVVQPIISPQKYVGNQIARTIGADAPAVADNIKNAAEFVPGSLPTTAQAGGSPTLVATEKAFANNNPTFKTALATRELQNNAARWDALNSVARTPEDLADAIAARSAVTQPLYDAAHAQIVPIDDSLSTLMARPAVKQAMQSADVLAKNEGVPIQWPTPENPQISGKALDYTNRALGDLIGNAKSANNPELAKALTSAQKQLGDWITSNVPGVKEAASDYAAFSSPVNTMQAGQQIANTLGGGTLGAGVDRLPVMPFSGFKTAVKQALKKQDYGIDQGAAGTLQNIQNDLQRSTVSNSLRTPGSDTAYNLAANGWLAKQIYGQNFGGATGLGRVLGSIGAMATGHPYIGAGLLMQGNKLGLLAGNRLSDQLKGLLLDPQSLLPYLENAQPQQVPQALLPGLRRNVSQGLLGAATAQRAAP